MNKRVMFGCLFLSAACVAAIFRWPWASQSQDSPGLDADAGTQDLGAHEEHADNLYGQRQPNHSGWSNTVLGYISEGLRQEIVYGSSLDANDPTRLNVLNYSPWHAFDIMREPSETYQFSASFEILCARAKTRDHFYVAGRAPNGDDVIERWKRANIAPPPGGGEAYVMQRKELYRGAGVLDTVTTLGVDHQARYLLIIHGDNPIRLSKMMLPAGGTPTTIYTSTQIPALAMNPIGVFQRRHAVQGVIWTIEGTDEDGLIQYVLMFDADDNGVIESFSSLGAGTYFDHYSVTSGVWVDTFLED